MNILVEVCTVEQEERGWPPTQIDQFLEWFLQKVESIPDTCRDSAEIIIDSRSWMRDESYATISIRYLREETEKEAERRLQKEDKQAQEKRARTVAFERELARRERAELHRLKQKYEGKHE